MEQRTQSCRGNERIVRLAAAEVLLTPGAAFRIRVENSSLASLSHGVSALTAR